MKTSDKIKQGFKNKEFGEFCEQLASEYFITNGYTIRARNWKLNKIEIDLILEKDRTIIFVEVKGRYGDKQDPVEAVNDKKRHKMIAGADTYMRQLSLLYQYRFDIFAVSGNMEDYEISHISDAFMPSVNRARC